MAEGLNLDIDTVKEWATKWKSLAELMGVKWKWKRAGEDGEEMDVDEDEEKDMDVDDNNQSLRDRLR